MTKTKTVFVCSLCGSSYPKWMGKCNACGEWNSIEENIIEHSSQTKKRLNIQGFRKKVEPILISEIDQAQNERVETRISELNRVLGGGLVAGSLILVGGQPGIGKSTLMLQLALSLPLRVLYVSGEESAQQIRMRAERLTEANDQCFILTETGVEQILDQAQKLKPDLIIVDSIQTLNSNQLDSSAGTISQVRECTHILMQYAKRSQVPVVLIGHITKDGMIAGPKILEHIVDVVLQFEGDRNHMYRLLRTLKNRYGSTDEIGIFEMKKNGLFEVSNPSELLLSQSDESFSGCAVAAMIEGQRPMLIEVQSLVSSAVYGTPQRSATGFDLRRLSMLLAVVEKRGGFIFGQQDVFLNIAGGIKVTDPGIDLSVVAALISSFENRVLDKSFCFAGEIGLSGEVRPVSRIELRLAEAARLGFRKFFMAQSNAKNTGRPGHDIEVVGLTRVEDLYTNLFQ